MNLTPIVQYLENEGLGTIGKDLFRNFMPHDIESGLLVVAQTPVPIDRYLGVCRGSFQVVARAKDWESPRIRMNNVSAVLRTQGLVLDDMLFHFITPTHEPLLFPASPGDLIEASVNFEFTYGLIS